jgi:hypothetical protein
MNDAADPLLPEPFTGECCVAWLDPDCGAPFDHSLGNGS